MNTLRKAAEDAINAYDLLIPTLPGMGDSGNRWLRKSLIEATDALRAALAEPVMGAVHPRDPVVVKWRNDGIEACADIADAYGNADAARDMRALITRAIEAELGGKK